MAADDCHYSGRPFRSSWREIKPACFFRNLFATDFVPPRGIEALFGQVDILIEMRWHAAPGGSDRHRRLLCWSRYEETPRKLVIELSADGKTFASCGDIETVNCASYWPALTRVLKSAGRGLSRKEIRSGWPDDQEPPSHISLLRWLTREFEAGRLLRAGEGLPTKPHLYSLAHPIPK
jgi:hypothetical protein